ncbi:hypothetical protein CHS0354_027330 [Potamilus streckersoni]|uniref:Uncharacterized protein n=1 Tax=Potamilus streckersoni TaxID=2493646 RepID=A0AAE0SAU6_9BIVA|nr:hypothetical protein CHS0354_027330 [Potamilus streckersoni]
MKFFGSTAVVLLFLVVKDVLSKCPEKGCECGFSCVDSNSKWCNSENDDECSCEKGCLVYDTLLKPGESNTIYCLSCNCTVDAEQGQAYCNGTAWCTPSHFKEDIDYPGTEIEFRNCGYYESYYEDSSENKDFEKEDFPLDESNPEKYL